MKRLTLVFGLLLLVATGCFGEATNAIPSVREFVARFKQADGNIDYKRLQSELGVRSNPFEEPPAEGIFTVTTAHETWKLVKLFDAWKTAWQYLVFRRQKGGAWAFVGNIDFGDQHYEEPSVSLKTIEGRCWLVFQHVAAYGTGLFERKEDWYPVDVKIGKPDLSYLSQGYFTEEEGNIKSLVEYRRTGLITLVINGNPAVVVSHKVVRKRVGNGEEIKVVNQREVKTRFVWSEEKKRFVASGAVQDPRVLD
jgi:hypothetical protein